MTGSLMQAFLVCKRQAWLLAHQLVGDQENDTLYIGKIVAEDSYSRDKKEIVIDEGIIDVLRTEDGQALLIEVKKSSKMLKSAEYQLLLYMRGTKTHYGEIRIPKEKKVVKVELTDEKLEELNKIEKEAEELINAELPPKPEKVPFCDRCSYEYFCWS